MANAATGALVASVTKGGPAQQYKIRVGDVILRFDNKVVGEMRRLPRIVAETTVGKAVAVEVWNENTLSDSIIGTGTINLARGGAQSVQLQHKGKVAGNLLVEVNGGGTAAAPPVPSAPVVAPPPPGLRCAAVAAMLPGATTRQPCRGMVGDAEALPRLCVRWPPLWPRAVQRRHRLACGNFPT